MEIIVSIVKYFFLGIFGLFVFAILFGRRIEKLWDLEAEFIVNEKECGELDLRKIRTAKTNDDYEYQVKFRLRDSRLTLGSEVEVFVGGELILSGCVEEDGFIALSNEHAKNVPESPTAGDTCRVLCSGQELFSQYLVND